MSEFEAAFFYGDFSVLQALIQEILAENDKAMDIHEEI